MGRGIRYTDEFKQEAVNRDGGPGASSIHFPGKNFYIVVLTNCVSLNRTPPRIHRYHGGIVRQVAEFAVNRGLI